MVEKDYKKLWWKISLTIIGFSVIPLIVLALNLYGHFSVTYTDKIMDNLRTLAENRKGAVDLFFEERVAQLVTLANTNSLNQLSNEDYLNKVFNIIQTRSRSYIDLGIIDQEGNHLAYVGPYHSILKGVNYKDTPWFDAAMSTGFYISDVFLGFRKVPHFIIAVMVREKDRNWILRATINSDIIEDIVHAGQIGKTGDAYIINRDNILQTTPRYSGKLLEHPQGQNFASTVSTVVEAIDFEGENFLYAAAMIKTNKWVMVIKEDAREPLAPLLRAKYIVVFLSLTGFLLIVAGAVLTTRSMMQQLISSDRDKAISDELVMQSSKMAALGKMAAGIAHEINNPLAVIGEKAGWIKDLLVEEDIGESTNFHEFEDAVNKIEYHVSRAKKVTHRLLGFARRMEPVSENVNVNKVLDESTSFLENEARYRNIDIQKNYAPDIPFISSDSTQLQQVFLNIINNGIDAIGKDGKIIIKTKHRSRDQEISIEIADNGPGIPKDILPKIFDPFFTTKDAGKGTGLGLSITYSIVEQLGGKLSVASEINEGTTFTITLPVK
jgi:two-component system NtrC family sensor kinase